MPPGNREDQAFATARHLIVQKRYDDAIALLRSQLQGSKATMRKRLQFADVLILAGRGADAIPILLELADELAGEGFFAKAVAVLKRVDKVEPGRSDVQERLAKLVGPPRAPQPRPALIPPPAPEPAAAGVEAGPPPASPDPEPVSPAEPPAEPPVDAAPGEPAPPAAEAVPGVASAPGVDAAPSLETAPGVAPAVAIEPAPLPEAPPDDTTPLPPSVDPGLLQRLRVTLRRFVPPSAPTPPEGKPAPAETAPPEAAAAGDGAPTPAVPPAMLAARLGRIFKRVLSTLPLPSATSPDGAPPGAAAAVPVEEAGTAPGAVAAPAEAEAPAAPSAAVEPAAEQAPAEAEPSPPAAEPTARAEEPAALLDFLLSESDLVREEFGGLGLDGQPSADVPEAWAPEDADDKTTAPPGAEEADETEAPGPEPPSPEPPSPEPPSPEPPAPRAVDAAEDAARGRVSAALLELDDAAFEAKLLDLIEDMILPEDPPPAPAPAPAAAAPGIPLPAEARRLQAIPPFADLGADELLAVVQGLQLLTFEPGQVVVTEGEEGQSLFIVASGAVTVFVRSPVGQSVEVARLGEGEFFGEISILSGRPRTATVVAAAPCELLELDKASLDLIAASHQRVRERLTAVLQERLASPLSALARAGASADPALREEAVDVLEAHFGQGGWSPRMKLRLADLLFKAGRSEEVEPILLGLADELARGGFPEKAVAVLKKVEQMRQRAPGESPAAPARERLPAEGPASPLEQARTADFFQGWLLELARTRADRAHPAAAAPPEGVPVEPARLAGYLGGLRASPIFQSLTEDDLLAFVQGLRLRAFDPGQIILTEGEPGQSLFVVAAGKVKVHVKNPRGRNVELAELGQAAVFGEIAALVDRPRSATVTAAAACELLELDRATLAAMDARCPGVRATLEEIYIERASNPRALRIRTFPS